MLSTLFFMASSRFTALILDFAGVLTDNMVEVFARFEQREGLRPMTFLRDGWGTPAGQRLYEQLELGEISQEQWNAGTAALVGIAPENLMGRLLSDMDPAYDMLKLAADARAAGMATAVVTNSLGRAPFDPYALYDLPGRFDVTVFSDQHGVRKPDPRIFELTCDQLSMTPSECVFVDDSEQNLPPAAALGMTVIHAVEEKVAVPQLRRLLEI
ncbi:HAD-IA family hydrolase [Catenulispora subtropica]|uniref:HAD-IA family hydrolase n=1 Tax=Catenulispora subtropica TaxID=450798 RepID=A0ABN2T9A2_9ACTN